MWPPARGFEHTFGPGLKVEPQYLTADRIGYLVKAGPHTGLAFAASSSAASGAPVTPPTAATVPSATSAANAAAYVADSEKLPLRNPAWSPDGKQVVYERVDFTARPQNQPLYSWDSNADYQYSDVFPRFSRDGKLAISDIKNLATVNTATISVMDADGSNKKVVFSDPQGAAFVPTWSPDGQWIAFGFGAFFGARETMPAKLMMVRSDGSKESKDLTKGAGQPNSGLSHLVAGWKNYHLSRVGRQRLWPARR